MKLTEWSTTLMRSRIWLRTALLGVCVALAACTSRVDLMGAVAEDEANEVIAALLQSHIAAEKVAGKEGLVSVRVPSQEVGAALQLLRERGLPRERYAGMGQVFKKEGLISSPLEERARYIYALSQELSHTLSKIDGVLSARVHVVLPERGVAGEAGISSTAAVFIKYQDGYNLEILQPQIRRLVTNSIPSLSADNVSVVAIASQQRASADATPVPAIRVWGMAVDPGSAVPLSLLLWGLLVIALLGLGAAAGVWWRWGPRSRAGQRTTTVVTTSSP